MPNIFPVSNRKVKVRLYGHISSIYALRGYMLYKPHDKRIILTLLLGVGLLFVLFGLTI